MTGSNSGVGYKTAETMLYLGADVILACRNMQRACDAQKSLSAGYPGSHISVLELDLADFSSIDAFVEKIREKKIDIDVFVNNAGVFHQPGKKTRDGFDLVIGTNYFGVYYLTEKLLPYLTSLPHKVTYINTISLAHRFAKLDYKDFYHSRKYNALSVYSISKLCLGKYSFFTAKKLEGSNVSLFMNHPGIALTPLGLNAVGPRYAKLAKIVTPLFNSPEKSSLSVAYILSHTPAPGSVVGPDRIFYGWGYPKLNHTSRKLTTGAEQLIAFTQKEILGKLQTQ